MRTKTVAHEALAECVTDGLMSLMNLLVLYEKQQKIMLMTYASALQQVVRITNQNARKI